MLSNLLSSRMCKPDDVLPPLVMGRKKCKKGTKKGQKTRSVNLRNAKFVASSETETAEVANGSADTAFAADDGDTKQVALQEATLLTPASRCPHVGICQRLTEVAIMKAEQESEKRMPRLKVRSERLWHPNCVCGVHPQAIVPPLKPEVDRFLSETRALQEEPLLAAANFDPAASKINSDICERGERGTLSSKAQLRPHAVMPTRGRLYNDHGETRRPVMHDTEDENDAAFPRGLTGLCNLGNTCYLNAAVQALSNCPPLTEFFRSTTSLAPFTSNVTSHEAEPPISRSFRLLLHVIWSRNRSGCANPQLLLAQMRKHCSQFRGWGQQDSQEFIRCFLDLLHRELRQPVFPWENREILSPSLPASGSGACLSTYSSPSAHSLTRSRSSQIRDERGPRKSSTSSSSDQSSTGADHYETADSGWSSDGDAPSKSLKSSTSEIRARKRCRSESLEIMEGSSIEASDSRYSARSSPTSEQHNRPDIDIAEHADCKREAPVRYRSIISEVFDGQLRSAVKCLTCHHVSETHETFQDLSLSIPTKEQLDRIAAASFIKEENDFNERDSDQEQLLDGEPAPTSWQWLWWLSGGWLRSLVGYFFGGSISLVDTLNAFFSPDDLRGENMYSCEKCAKLRNGVKICKITRLPEVLVIHLKRFRHDASYSSKVSTSVTFPLCDLDLSPFTSRSALSHDNRTLYDLCAFVTHHGSSAESGHYLAYCKNEMDNNWYEFDDTVVTRTEPADVMSKEAYVLFYQKRGTGEMQRIREHVTQLLGNESVEKKVKYPSHYYVSREWFHRLSTFSYPGPITNHDFLCEHAQILPRRAAVLPELYATVDPPTWEFLHKKFGGGPVCTELHYCPRCQTEYQWLRHKREREITTFKAVEARLKTASLHYPALTYGYYLPPNVISKSWVAKWRAFVEGEELEPPGAIDNTSLLVRCSKESAVYFRRSSPHIELPRELWLFFVSNYGGGPEVFSTSDVLPTEEEIPEMISQIEIKMADALESLKPLLKTDVPRSLLSVAADPASENEAIMRESDDIGDDGEVSTANENDAMDIEEVTTV